MDFTNINDPAGVTALLEKLRSSQAWTELQSEANESSQEHSGIVSQPSFRESINTIESSDDTNAHPSGPSVASLLSQLSSINPSKNSSAAASKVLPLPNSSQTTNSATQFRDFRAFNFQQSLPHLAKLSEDPVFLSAIAKLRKDQESLEKRLWDEREAIREKQQQKVNTAITKANMLNIGISAREAEALKSEFTKELGRFDREQVLPAWDDLVTKQQAALEKLGVPMMFMTDSTSDRERQQRIISVIEGITGPDNN